MKKREKEKSIWEISKRSVLQVIFSRTMLIMVLIVMQFAYIIARMYAWAEHVPLLLGGEFFVIAIMMAIILNSKENPSVKLSWCFLVGVLPIFGSVVYFVVKQDFGYRVIQRRIRVAEKQCKGYLPKQDGILEELKEKDIQTYHIAQYLQRTGTSLVSKNNQVTYFPIGEKMFAEMVKRLESAKEYIFLEYFMIAHGTMWDSILKVLEKKAKEGVEVRLLYDGTCSVSLLPYKYPKEIEKLGIKCRMFAPPVPFLSTHYNNRDHRKIMVIDGHVAFTGGVNLCDEYININSPFGHWKDVGIMIEGGAVFDYTLMFMQMWSATIVHRTSEIKLPNMKKYISDASRDYKDSGYVIPFADTPVNDETVGKNVYIDILNQAKEYVYIMTPYLILDGEMIHAITFAAKRGVDVRIILPHIPDKIIPFILARDNYKVLLESGVKVFEYTPGFVHAKVFIADNERAVVGTMNLDYRSLYWHYECAAYLCQVPAIEDIYKDFVDTQKKCEKMSFEKIKSFGILTKIAAFVLKIVAPLL